MIVNNPDWMWGAAIDGGRSTTYASYFSHMDSFNNGYGRPGNVTKSVDKRLYDAMSESDLRKQEWFSDGERMYSSAHWKESKKLPKYINTKFYDPTAFLGDYSYMRRSETLFNYMEAAYKLGDEQTVVKMLNEYMSTRDKNYTLSAAGNALFKELQLQKRIEFWGEGFALLDMKRWGVSLVRSYPGTNHTLDNADINIEFPSDKFTFQFPISMINASQGVLTPQNPR